MNPSSSVAKTVVLTFVLVLNSVMPTTVLARQDRGIGVKPTVPVSASPSDKPRDATPRPELVLQTGYGNFTGAGRFLFSPDGKLIATTALGDANVKLWDVATGRELRMFYGNPLPVYSTPVVAYSPNSRALAISGGENTVKLWDIATGREIHSFSPMVANAFLPSAISFIGFSADGRSLVIVADRIKTYDVVSGVEQSSGDLSVLGLGGIESAAALYSLGMNSSFGLSADGKQLALVVNDRRSSVKYKVVDVASGREIDSQNLQGIDDPADVHLSCAAFTREGRVLVAAIDSGSLKLFDSQGKAQTLAKVAENTIFGFNPGGELLSASSSDGTVNLWDSRSGRKVVTIAVPRGFALKLGFPVAHGVSPDGKMLATTGSELAPILWDVLSGVKVGALTGSSNLSYNVSFSEDGTRLIAGSRTVWDLRTGQGLRAIPGEEKIFGLLTNDAKLVAKIDLNSNAVQLIESPSGRILHTLTPTTAGVRVAQIAVSPDSRLMATTYASTHEQTSGQTKVVTKDLSKAAKEALKNLPRNQADLTKIYSQQMPGFAPQGIEGEVKIWDLQSGREVRTIMAGDYSKRLAFSRDGGRLAVFGVQGAITLWDVTSGAQLQAYGQTLTQQFLGMPGAAVPVGPSSGTNAPVGVPNLAAIQSAMDNVLGGMAAGTGTTKTSLALSRDGRQLAVGGVNSKSDLNLAAMISASMSGRTKPKDLEKQFAEQFKNAKRVTTGEITLYDAVTGQQTGALSGHGKGVEQVAFSPDGRLLASSATDNSIKVWDVASKTGFKVLTGQTGNINSIAFSPDGRLLASGGDDGATFLWDIKTGEHLVTLISLFDGGEWLVVTPDGLFDGSPRAWNQILWRYNGNTFDVAPIEWFFDEFYYPGLLADIVAGQRPRASADISKKDRRQPIVDLRTEETPTPEAKVREQRVRVTVTDTNPGNETNGSGGRDVRLFRNGSLVRAWRGDVLNGQTSVVLDATVPITAGRNELTAYAFNRDNVKSKDAVLSITGSESLRRAGVLYVVAVGINRYENEQFNLRYAVADAREFSSELVRHQSRLPDFARTEVVPLLDADATKTNILEALRRLAGQRGAPSLKSGVIQTLERLQPAQPEDAVIIYFAGHGIADGQRFYLVPHDLGYAGDRSRVDATEFRRLVAHGISDEEIEVAVEHMNAGKMMLVIDACNSGQALEAEEKRRGPMNSKGLAQLAYEKGIYVLTAAQSFQAALEASQLGHGLLTYALIEEGLKSRAADDEPKDGTVFAREWFNFATVRVPEIQQQKMNETRGLSMGIAFVEGEERVSSPDRRNVQRPRAFYRRELEANPFIVAKP